eukprot:5381583-Pyramimonas_sp.AAC.1
MASALPVALGFACPQRGSQRPPVRPCPPLDYSQRRSFGHDVLGLGGAASELEARSRAFHPRASRGSPRLRLP